MNVPDVEVVAVASQHFPHAVAFAERFSGRPYESVEQLLERASCDVIYICVPPDAHGRIEELVIDAHLPFFVEKPLAHDLDTAERIAEKLASNPVLTATGYHWRYSRSVERASTLLQEHPPIMATAYWLDRVPPPAWWQRREQSGGQVVEQATHLLDTLRVLLGEWTGVCGMANRPVVADGLVDRAVVSALRFRSGAIASLVCTSMLQQKGSVGIDVVGEGLWIRVMEDRLERLDGGVPQIVPNGDDPRERVDRAFIEALRGVQGAEIRSSYKDALQTQRLAFEITQAAAGNAR